MKILVHRPGRSSAPVAAPEPLAIAAPPQLPPGQTGGFPIQTLLPVLGAVSSMTMMLVSRGSNPIYLVIGSMVFVVAVVSGLTMTLTTRARATRSRKLSRERYLDYLEELRTTLSEDADSIRASALHTDPEPVVLPQIIADPARVWERRSGDLDFLRARIGVGTVAWRTLTCPREQNPVQPLDPLLLAEAERLGASGALVEDLPIWIDLGRGGDIAIIGPREATEALTRAVIAQAVTFHSPDDLRVAAVYDPAHADAWSGLDHLPHTQVGPTSEGLPRAMVAASLDELASSLSSDLTARMRRVASWRHWGREHTSLRRGPQLVLILDEHDSTAQRFPIPEEGYGCADLGLTILHLLDDRLDEPSDVTLRISVGVDGRLTLEDSGPASHRATTGRADIVTPALFAAIAHNLAPLTLTNAGVDQASTQPDTVSAMRLFGLTDVTSLSTDTAWAPRSSRDFLRVPIGVDDHGAPLVLDLKESAQLGMGPHGICVGATGSGKSELLRTLVLSLALTHSPEDLSMILVDYKGGAAFAPFASLAHVAGLIDNLADDPQLTRRARESIAGEVLRRQAMLKNAGSAPSISHYRQMRIENPALPPMPHLFLVIDEFGELLTAEPEFSDLLLKIGRIGRSIGVHLLLASQRIEGGMLRGLDTHLSYWIGMRTFSDAESRAILGTTDAYTLPNQPGYAYLKVDTSVYTRFRAAYVSGPVSETPSGVESPAVDLAVQVVPPFNLPDAIVTVPAEEQLTPPDVSHLLVDEVIARLTTAAHTTPVWLPPLPTRISLGSVLNDETLSRASGSLTTPIGLLDDPSRQSQTAWMLDLTAHGGHTAIVGAPQTGRSTFLRTIAVSLGLTHTPRQVSVYGIDLTGAGLDRIETFPHVGGVATRADRARLTRLLEELHAMLATREALFRSYHLDSVAALRAVHARSPLPGIVAPDVVILVDGVDPIRNEFDDLDQPFTDLLQRGGTFGLHVVMALTRWNELRTTLQPLIGQRFELRLNDPGDSSLQRAAALALKSAAPGRALTQDLTYGQIALPVLDDSEDDVIGDTINALGSRVAAAWSGPAAAPIRLLPDDLDPAVLPDKASVADGVPIGLRQDTFEPLVFGLATDQHLMVFGDAQCGKTTLLTGLVQGLLRRYTPDQLVFAAMDPRGHLAALIPDEFLGGQAANANEALALANAVAHELDKRPRNPASTYPAVVVLVDDYDIIAAGGTHPLAPLLPYLPSARDLKLSIILTRPAAGAGRALLDPTIQALRDTGGSGLVMNGERSEGPILPKVYAEPFPPGRGRYVRRGTAPRIIQIAHFHTGTPT